jgi:hypothetical protein
MKPCSCWAVKCRVKRHSKKADFAGRRPNEEDRQNCYAVAAVWQSQPTARSTVALPDFGSRCLVSRMTVTGATLLISARRVESPLGQKLTNCQDEGSSVLGHDLPNRWLWSAKFCGTITNARRLEMKSKLPLVSVAFTAGLLAQHLVSQATPAETPTDSQSRLVVSQPISPSFAAREKLKKLFQRVAAERGTFTEESGPTFVRSDVNPCKPWGFARSADFSRCFSGLKQPQGSGLKQPQGPIFAQSIK